MDSKEILTNFSQLSKPQALLFLDEQSKKYPWFSGYAILKAKHHSLLRRTDFKDQLHKAALYATDRNLLFQYITNEDSIVSEEAQTPLVLDDSKISEEIPYTETELEIQEPITSQEANQETETQEPIYYFEPLTPQEAIQETDNQSEEVKLVQETGTQEPIYYFEPLTPQEVIQETDNQSDEVALIQETETQEPIFSFEPFSPQEVIQETDNQSEEVALVKETETHEPIFSFESFNSQEVIQEKDSQSDEVEIVQETETQEPIFSFEPIDTGVSFSDLMDKDVIVQNEILENPKPLTSFAEWLASQKGAQGYTHLQPKDRDNRAPSPQIPPILEKEKTVESDKLEVIDAFIATEPKLTHPTKFKQKFFNPDEMAKKSDREDDSLATETLAKIYAEQGYLDKAEEIYQKLMLKFPNKSGYFASQIQDLKKEN